MEHPVDGDEPGGLSAETERVGAIFRILADLWPDSRPLLSWKDPFQLLCAVVLSAQCTDEQVNRVTPRLFERWPDAMRLAHADTDEVESVVHSVGFFRTKAANLVRTARLLLERHGGRVPDTMEALLELPGVGRKTANLVISACFGKPGIIVDTHVLRAGGRLGILATRDAAAMERRIAELVDVRHWTAFSHALNRHGKFTCTARNPACVAIQGRGGTGMGVSAAPCPVESLCPGLGLAGRRSASPSSH